MAHPKNKSERRQRLNKEKEKIKRFSSYGYNPYIGWAVVPKEMAPTEKWAGRRFYYRSALNEENANKPFYTQQVNGNMAELRRYYKRKANRQFRRNKNITLHARAGHKRHYDISSKTI